MKFARAAAYGGAMAALGLAVPAYAVTLMATSSSFSSVFASANAGDTIVLSGRFGRLDLANRSFDTPLRIDATRASFSGPLNIVRLNGLSVTGGRFGPGAWQNAGTIRVFESSNIGFTRPILTGDGLGAARGLTFTNSDGFSVTGGSFSGFRLAIGVIESTDGLLASNRITRATSDGMNIVGSHRVTARGNVCSGGIPSAGAHPDCIQLWSIAGKPPQSDIRLLRNVANGPTQGFTSFTPANGGGLRISMIGNRVNTSMPQGIACYGCVDSIITDNVLTTLPGSLYRTSLNVVGGSNNIVARNSIGPRVAAPRLAEAGSGFADSFLYDGEGDAFADFEGNRFYDAFAVPGAFAEVPEPATWLQLLTGFALIGSLLRRRSGEVRLQEAG
jgi:hypothetical protein